MNSPSALNDNNKIKENDELKKFFSAEESSFFEFEKVNKYFHE